MSISSGLNITFASPSIPPLYEMPFMPALFNLSDTILASLSVNLSSAGREFSGNKSINNSRGSYYGVYKYGDLYYVKSYANGKEISLGAYYDEIAACNVYNNFSKMINSNSTIPLLNDVPKMTPSEILQHMYTENNIIVCKKVNK